MALLTRFNRDSGDPPPSSSPSRQVAWLDHTAFPHILDLVVAFADYGALLALRRANRDLRDRAAVRVFNNAALVCLSPTRVYPHGAALLRTPCGRKLPLANTGTPDRSTLRLIRILDIVDPKPADEELPQSGGRAYDLLQLLQALKPEIVRQHGSRRIPPPISCARVYVDWTWRSAPPSYMLYPPPFDPLLLQYEHDTEPHLPPCPRIILHCPQTLLQAALADLLPLIQSISSRTREVVVVFQPWRQMRCLEAGLEGVSRVPQILAAVVDAVEDEVAARKKRRNNALSARDEGEMNDACREAASFELTLVGLESVHPDSELEQPCPFDQHSGATLASPEDFGTASCSSSNSNVDTAFGPTVSSKGGERSIGEAERSHSGLAISEKHVGFTLLSQAAAHSTRTAISRCHSGRGTGVSRDGDGWGEHVHFVSLAEWQARHGPLAALEAS